MTVIDRSDPTRPCWQPYGEGLERMKVPGGYIYTGVKGLVFVPATAVVEEARLDQTTECYVVGRVAA